MCDCDYEALTDSMSRMTLTTDAMMNRAKYDELNYCQIKQNMS